MFTLSPTFNADPKKAIFITLILFLFVNVNAQTIKYESSLSAAEQKSATSVKLCFSTLTQVKCNYRWV